MQVELAQLEYMLPRLARMWTHLEKTRGGIGLRGPGETQIETDRRLIRHRIKILRGRLEDVRRSREVQRAGRRDAFKASLVGYTNAGKSTLFNRLTGAEVMAEDLLFATLDPTMRAIELPGVEKAILSDTVGFISDLPTQLVAAFRATLEEVTGADLIVHVRDIANASTAAQKAQVVEVLGDLGVAEGEGGIPILEVWNKLDLVAGEQADDVREAAAADAMTVPISAATGEGVAALVERLGELLTKAARVHEFVLPASAGRRIAWLHAHGEVLEDGDAGSGADGPLRRLAVRLNPKEFGRFEAL